jgi:hypothetical protein
MRGWIHQSLRLGQRAALVPVIDVLRLSVAGDTDLLFARSFALSELDFVIGFVASLVRHHGYLRLW